MCAVEVAVANGSAGDSRSSHNVSLSSNPCVIIRHVARIHAPARIVKPNRCRSRSNRPKLGPDVAIIQFDEPKRDTVRWQEQIIQGASSCALKVPKGPRKSLILLVRGLDLNQRHLGYESLNY